MSFGSDVQDFPMFQVDIEKRLHSTLSTSVIIPSEISALLTSPVP
jgi:hypothetical protein